MEVIDEQGNLFGTVNVVDAIVVVVALGVVSAGLAILGPATDTTESRYVTIVLDDQPAYVAERISAGDVMERDGQNLTITEVYAAPGRNGGVSLSVAAEVHGPEASDRSTIRFDGDGVRPGRTIDVRTAHYAVTGTVTSVRDDPSGLDVGRTVVTISSIVDGEVANSIQEGDTYDLAGREVGAVDSVSVFPTLEGEQRRVLLTLDLATIRIGDGPRFGNHQVEVGDSVPFSTDGYTLNGTVLERGSSGDDGTTDAVTAVVKLENVEPEVASAVEAGDVERTRGTTYARVTDKRVEPAVVVLTSVDGDIHQRDHPRNKDVYLTVALEVRETRDGLRFHGERLRRGNEVVLDLNRITVNGSVVDLDPDP